VEAPELNEANLLPPQDATQPLAAEPPIVQVFRPFLPAHDGIAVVITRGPDDRLLRASARWPSG
jgi:hypothetical protein